MKAITAILVSLLLVATIFAGEETLKGKGTLTAQGKGIIKLKGTGDVELSGDGKLWVVDCSMDGNLEVTVTGKGTKIQSPSFIYMYKGFDGTVTISGGPMKFVLEGKDIDFTGTGKGVVHLKGHGTYQKGEQAGEWTEEGIEITVFEY